MNHVKVAFNRVGGSSKLTNRDSFLLVGGIAES